MPELPSMSKIPKPLKSLAKYILILALVYIVAYHGSLYYMRVRADQAAPPQAYLYHYVHHEPYIQGPSGFQQDVKKALAAVKQASPEQYQDIEKYCVRIKLVEIPTNNGAMAKYKSIYIFENGYQKSQENEHYLKQVLVHETTHLIQYAQGRNKLPIEQREAEALASERQLLTALKVPSETIEQLAGAQLLKTKWWENDKQIWTAMGRK